MATLTDRNPTLFDLAQATDSSGRVGRLVEILNQTNEVLDDMVWKEGNLITGNRTFIRSGIPTPTWRALYGFVNPSKSTRVQVTDNCGQMWAYSEVDKKLADLGGNTAQFRMDEDYAHIEGMSQEMAKTLFYGNEATTQAAFTGLSPRFNSTSAQNGDNLFDVGGTGNDTRSVWMIVWGDNTVHGIIPKGSMAGLQMVDLGEEMIQDVSSTTAGGRMQAYVSYYTWDAGLTVKDWRYVARIHNIPSSPTAAQRKTLIDQIFRAYDVIPNMNAGKACLYMSRDMRTEIRVGLSEGTKGSVLKTENVGGTRVETLYGVPLKRVDALAASETAFT